ncbi:hypothetical protein RFI_35109, partial [Reticulomyxa filosa]
EILNIRISQMPVVVAEEKKRESKGWTSTEMVALIAYTRVDYALRVCQEMHHCVISNNADERGLSVTLLNGDARNLKWKKNRFEYVYCHFPIQKAKGLSACRYSYLNDNNNNKLETSTNSISKSSQLSSDCLSVSSHDSTDTISKSLSNNSGGDQCIIAPSLQQSPSWSSTTSSCLSSQRMAMPELNLPPSNTTTRNVQTNVSHSCAVSP